MFNEGYEAASGEAALAPISAPRRCASPCWWPRTRRPACPARTLWLRCSCSRRRGSPPAPTRRASWCCCRPGPLALGPACSPRLPTWSARRGRRPVAVPPGGGDRRRARAAPRTSRPTGRISWPYDALLAVNPSPVVALNRAVAVAKVHGPGAGLRAAASRCGPRPRALSAAARRARRAPRRSWRPGRRRGLLPPRAGASAERAGPEDGGTASAGVRNGREQGIGNREQPATTTERRPRPEIRAGAPFVVPRVPTICSGGDLPAVWRGSPRRRETGAVSGLPEPAQETDSSTARLRSGPPQLTTPTLRVGHEQRDLVALAHGDLLGDGRGLLPMGRSGS